MKEGGHNRPSPSPYLRAPRQRARHLRGTGRHHDVSFTVESGELAVLVGRSGSGKTTLLRAITGYAPLSGGRVSIGGEDVTRQPPARRDIAMVFQSYSSTRT